MQSTCHILWSPMQDAHVLWPAACYIFWSLHAWCSCFMHTQVAYFDPSVHDSHVLCTCNLPAIYFDFSMRDAPVLCMYIVSALIMYVYRYPVCWCMCGWLNGSIPVISFWCPISPHVQLFIHILSAYTEVYTYPSIIYVCFYLWPCTCLLSKYMIIAIWFWICHYMKDCAHHVDIYMDKFASLDIRCPLLIY